LCRASLHEEYAGTVDDLTKLFVMPTGNHKPPKRKKKESVWQMGQASSLDNQSLLPKSLSRKKGPQLHVWH
jgi:hypothetical protein